MTDMFEVAASQVALEKTQNPDIRVFAQMMITEHQKSTADLKQTLEDAKLPALKAATLDSDHETEITKLRGTAPALFDRTFERAGRRPPEGAQTAPGLRAVGRQRGAEEIRAIHGFDRPASS